MGRLVVNVPSSLEGRLKIIAEREGVSLEEYVLYVLAQQVSKGYVVEEIPPEDLARQKEAFEALLRELGTVSDEEAWEILSEREPVGTT